MIWSSVSAVVVLSEHPGREGYDAEAEHRR
jgi:hypothetical protein